MANGPILEIQLVSDRRFVPPSEFPIGQLFSAACAIVNHRPQALPLAWAGLKSRAPMPTPVFVAASILHFEGVAGQSFVLPCCWRGLNVRLEGDANDYVVQSLELAAGSSWFPSGCVQSGRPR